MSKEYYICYWTGYEYSYVWFDTYEEAETALNNYYWFIDDCAVIGEED
jgi:hypothetical protein